MSAEQYIMWINIGRETTVCLKDVDTRPNGFRGWCLVNSVMSERKKTQPLTKLVLDHSAYQKEL